MHAIKWLHNQIEDALPQIHGRRLQALFAGIEGLLVGQQLTLSGVGRHLRGETKEKHKIKRIDRLLGNAYLCSERSQLYRWLCGLLIGGCRHPSIIVDWSDIDSSKSLFLLRAAVSVNGRSLVLFEAVYDRYHHPRDTRDFLNHLANCLPPGCQPIIVTDAGFRSPWFKVVEALGWYYVGRIRNRDHVCFAESDDWVPAKSLYAEATARAKSLGTLWLPRADPWQTHAYIVHKKPRGRVHLTAHGERRRNGPSLKHAKREREPWLLVSNLPVRYTSAKRVVAIYRERMTIEESFRDLKAHRHGFAFRQNLGRDPQRVANLLVIAALAMMIVWVTGLMGIARGLERSLQANTVTKRRVLSIFFVGNRLLQQHLTFTHHEWIVALRQITTVIYSHSFDDAYN